MRLSKNLGCAGLDRSYQESLLMSRLGYTEAKSTIQVPILKLNLVEVLARDGKLCPLHHAGGPGGDERGVGLDDRPSVPAPPGLGLGHLGIAAAGGTFWVPALAQGAGAFDMDCGGVLDLWIPARIQLTGAD